MRKNIGKSVRDIWNTQKSLIHVIGIPEGEERQKGTEAIFKELLTENFQTLIKKISNFKFKNPYESQAG